jgi:hypothetical protein
MASPLNARASVFAAAQRSRIATAPGGGLADFIPSITPGYARPTHLAPLVELLERARREPVRVVPELCAKHLGPWLEEAPPKPATTGSIGSLGLLRIGLLGLAALFSDEK